MLSHSFFLFQPPLSNSKLDVQISVSRFFLSFLWSELSNYHFWTCIQGRRRLLLSSNIVRCPLIPLDVRWSEIRRMETRYAWKSFASALIGKSLLRFRRYCCLPTSHLRDNLSCFTLDWVLGERFCFVFLRCWDSYRKLLRERSPLRISWVLGVIISLWRISTGVKENKSSAQKEIQSIWLIARYTTHATVTEVPAWSVNSIWCFNKGTHRATHWPRFFASLEVNDCADKQPEPQNWFSA